MNTKITNKYPISEKKLKELIRGKLNTGITNLNKSISILTKEIKTNLSNNNSTMILNKNLLLLDKKCIFILDKSNSCISRYENLISSDLPSFKNLQKIKNYLNKEYGKAANFLCLCDDNRFSNVGKEVYYDPDTDNDPINSEEKSFVEVFKISFINIEKYDSNGSLLLFLILNELIPECLTPDSKSLFTTMVDAYKLQPKLFSIGENAELVFSGGDYLLEKFCPNFDKEWLSKLNLNFVKELLQNFENYDFGSFGEKEEVKKELLECEKNRADIEAYEKNLLSDPNRGHWDLWIEQSAPQYCAEIEEEMFARDPRSDIKENGVIAIDFGTKSTIVVFQSDTEHSLPMAIGDGELSKGPNPKRYENPTVMHFVNLNNFLYSYNSKPGRPYTKWSDLTISHTAVDQFANSKSENYYQFLHQIKQWAGQRKKQFRVKSDETGETMVLPAFLDIKDGDLNPIEIYAYYIGSYINNMRNGIYLDYYLSFPVTYEKKIREKIIKSFERGLKKSLPTVILNDEEIMKKFQINGDISEPAAYAVSALKEYGFDPKNSEEIFYGIFDFGGGTTDFDFGLWRTSSKKRYDYSIENFGAGGDQYLGGENLLEMLAFEVFKENQSIMREKNFTFTLAPKCNEFIGSESLLADSQEAEKNMHNLMEELRPYWEQEEDYLDNNRSEDNSSDEYNDNDANEDDEDNEDINDNSDECDDKDDNNKDNIKINVSLINKNGEDHPNIELFFSKKKLYDIIESRIREGVNNFFSALILSYQNDKVKKPKTLINILLAGNSCKSEIVYKVFDESMKENEKIIKEMYPEYFSSENRNIFEIFPPLGTERAYKKMESRGLNPNRDNAEKPTGKTGVAFGLIESRAGGSIERIINVGVNEEIPFQYYIGWRKKKKFDVFTDEQKAMKYYGKPDYNQWYKFIEADASDFDLYYTTLPECVNGDLIIDNNPVVKRLRCKINKVDENAFVYIRAIDPHTLEYVVSTESDLNTVDEKDITKRILE